MTDTSSPSLRVFLVRHAHAGWALPGKRDIDRSLDHTGRDEAARLAATMSVNGYAPDKVYCSPAQRCVETLDILTSKLALSPPIESKDALYFETNRAYTDLIAGDHGEATRSIMIVGHNPMLEDVTQSLLSSDPAAPHEALGAGFPTAGLLVADCVPGADPTAPGNTRFIALLSPIDA